MGDLKVLGYRSALLILAASTLPYLSALPNGFTYDDLPIVRDNPILTADQAWWAAWTQPYWPGTNARDELDVLYRPLPVQTYALERRFFGASPLPAHALNILIHACVSFLAASVGRRLGLSPAAALTGALLFAAHPIHTEAVANIVGRAELLSALGLLTAVRAEQVRMEQEQVEGGGARGALATAAMLLGAAVALFSKESSVAALGVVPACRWMKIALGSTTGGAGIGDDRRAAGRGALLRTVLPLALLMGLYFLIRYDVCAGRLWIGGSRFGPGNFLREATWNVRFWTPFALLGRYLALMFYPATLLSDYSLNVIVPVAAPFEPYAMLGIFAVGGGILHLTRKARHASPRWIVAIGFLTAYALASNALLLIDVLFAERLFYAPSLWVCMAMGSMLSRWSGAGVERRVEAHASGRGWIPLLSLVVLALGARTAVRNPSWRDTATLAVGDLERMPPGRRSSQLCYLAGRGAAQAGDFVRAERLLGEAIGIFNDFPDYLLALGESRMAAGNFRAALEPLDRAFELAPRRADVAMRRAQAMAQLQGVQPREALDAAREAFERRPNDASACREWARRAEDVDLEEALRAYQRLTRIDPEDPQAWNDLSRVAEMTGRREEAVSAARHVLDRWPENLAAHANLALMLMDRTDRGHFDCAAAESHAREAVRLGPQRWDLRVNLAEVLAACGKTAEAAAMFDELADQCERESSLERQYRRRAQDLRR